MSAHPIYGPLAMSTIDTYIYFLSDEADLEKGCRKV
jgi:hypothetical protein